MMGAMKDRQIKAIVGIRMLGPEKAILQRAVDTTGMSHSDLIRATIGLLAPFVGKDPGEQAMAAKARKLISTWSKLA
jgi:hypothetical protein